MRLNEESPLWRRVPITDRIACYKGGGGSPPPPRPPPSSLTAAEQLARSRIAERTKAARGYGSTILTSGTIGPSDVNQPGTVLKSLLGQ
jgi:hypothetical protein